MKMETRLRTLIKRMRTVQVVHTTGVIYIEVVVKGRLDHLNINVVLSRQTFLTSHPESISINP